MAKGIAGQCQEVDFYEVIRLWTTENEIAPVLVRAVQNQKFTEPELVALK